MQIVNNFIAIKEGKVLLVRKNVWTFPGGKLENGESNLECLSRETTEELPDLSLSNIQFYKTVTGQTPTSKKLIRVNFFLADAIGEITVGSEIKESIWTDSPNELNLSETTRYIIGFLQQDGYL